MADALRLLIHGACGKMGRAVTELAGREIDVTPVCGVDAMPGAADIPVFSSLEACTLPCDVIVDFSRPEALEQVLDFARSRHMAAVLATTGYTPEDLERVARAGRIIPVFRAANMSLGMNLLMQLVRVAAASLGEEADVEIIEAHHRTKLDAPSGTALMLYEAACLGRTERRPIANGRVGLGAGRTPGEVGIHSVRGGTLVGEHTVRMFLADEEIFLGHAAQSRTVYAMGALHAARFIVRQRPGVYGMRELLEERSLLEE